MNILVLSDTHIKGTIKELPSQVLQAIDENDILIHAGDFTSYNFFQSLTERIKVIGVYGNMDGPKLCNKLPKKRIIKLQGYKIGIIHGNQLNTLTADNLCYLFPETDIIIFGHSHKPENIKVEDKLLFNPGSSVKKRLQSHYSYGIISLAEDINSKIIRF